MISETVEDMSRKNTVIKVLSYEDMQELLRSFKEEPGLIEGDLDTLENAMVCMPAIMVEGWASGEKAAVAAAEITVRSVLDIISSCSYGYLIINCITDENINFDIFLEMESFIRRSIGDFYNENNIFMLTVRRDVLSNFSLFNIIISGIDDKYIKCIFDNYQI